MIEVLLIAGPSGSGKTYLQKRLIERGFAPIISATTREPREGEENGRDYHFKKDKDDFFKEEYIEYAQFRDDYYGTPKKEFYKADKIAHVIEPYGVRDILDTFKDDENVSIKVIFLNIDRETCKNNLKGDKGYLSEKEQERFDRDMKDSINDRLKEMKIQPDFEITALDYNVDKIIEEIYA